MRVACSVRVAQIDELDTKFRRSNFGYTTYWSLIVSDSNRAVIEFIEENDSNFSQNFLART